MLLPLSSQNFRRLRHISLRRVSEYPYANRLLIIFIIYPRLNLMTKNMKHKPVLLKYYYNNLEELETPTQTLKGVFQKWGDSMRYENDKCFALTIAIVLGDDGIVYTAPPYAVSLIK
jgi:hypothetical protein